MNSVHAMLLAAGVLAAAINSLAANNPEPLTTVNYVDLRRYAGKWHEIARYANRFQRDCASDTTANYVVRGDGKVQVVNSCRDRNGKLKTARGTAKVADKKTNAKLKVTFFWPFYGDYWIVGLSDDYQWAIVGEPGRKYLWVLSRTPSMDEHTYRQVLGRVRTLGYDPQKLLKTAHSAPGQ